MKAIQVLSYFLPQQTAGTEVYTWALSYQLQKMGVNVQIVIPHYGHIESSEYVYDELNVHQYAEPSIIDRRLILGFRAPDGLRNFINYIKEQKPDIVHFHELSGSNGITLQHVQAVKAIGAKVIMTFHLAGYSCKTGTLVYKEKVLCNGVIDLKKCGTCYLHAKGYGVLASYLVQASSLLQRLDIDPSTWNHKIGTALGTLGILHRQKVNLHALVDVCDQVVTISNWYQKILMANDIDPKKIVNIPQGLPVASFSPKSQINTTSNPIRLIFIGRISRFKGLHLLIDALNDIDPRLFQLSIYGSTDDDLYEKKLREQTKYRNNIHWNGKLEQHNVLTTMQQHDILCLCSTFSEMSPLVIQEAFAAGITVIASHVYGNAEQIQHGYNGLLFQFKDVKSLRKQIQLCVENPSLIQRFKNNIKQPAGFLNVAVAYHELYSKLLLDR